MSQDEFEAKRVSFFPSLQLTLNHILLVDWYYLDGLEKGGRGLSMFENELPFPDARGSGGWRKGQQILAWSATATA